MANKRLAATKSTVGARADATFGVGFVLDHLGPSDSGGRFPLFLKNKRSVPIAFSKSPAAAPAPVSVNCTVTMVPELKTLMEPRG